MASTAVILVASLADHIRNAGSSDQTASPNARDRRYDIFGSAQFRRLWITILSIGRAQIIDTIVKENPATEGAAVAITAPFTQR
jgi:hypothetical protein